VTEQIGKVVTEVIDGLKSAPVILALIALNAMMIGASLWFLKALAAAQASRFDVLLKACMGRMSP
jgi:hypothetical protein